MAFIDKYQLQIQENAPVVYEGLEFYPLLVREYPIYLRAKQSFELMLGSLRDPKLARLPWCACLWALDKKCEQQEGKIGDYLVNVLRVLAAALRLDANLETGTIPLRPVFSQSGDLTAIMLGNLQTNYTLLNMQQMNDVRQILAAQNDFDIPDENWNPELVQAAQENARRHNVQLETDFESLVYSVALNAHCRASDVYGWTIREFHKTEDAIDRNFGYLIFNMAEMSGNVTFKNGNPYPTWKFSRKNDMPTGFRTIADIDASAKGLISGT